MGICSVFECNNSTQKKLTPETSFHKFPKENPNLTRQWLLFCRRKDYVNIETARICSLHFQQEDFINNIQYEMGFSLLRLLKPDVVPTVRFEAPPTDTGSEPTQGTQSSKRMGMNKKKKLFDDLMEDSVSAESELDNENKRKEENVSDPLLLSTSASAAKPSKRKGVKKRKKLIDDPLEESVLDESEPEPENENVSDPLLLSTTEDHVDDSNEIIKTLLKENNKLNEKLSAAEKEINALQTRVKNAECHQMKLEAKLLEILRTRQRKKLKLGSLKRSQTSLKGNLLRKNITEE